MTTGLKKQMEIIFPNFHAWKCQFQFGLTSWTVKSGIWQISKLGFDLPEDFAILLPYSIQSWRRKFTSPSKLGGKDGSPLNRRGLCQWFGSISNFIAGQKVELRSSGSPAIAPTSPTKHGWTRTTRKHGDSISHCSSPKRISSLPKVLWR